MITVGKPLQISKKISEPPQRQARPDIVVVRTIGGGNAKLRVSIDEKGILCEGRPFVQKLSKQVGEKQLDEFLRKLLHREGDLTRFLGDDHENLIRCHGRFTNEAGEECLLLEYEPGESVEERLARNPNKKLETKEVCQIISDVCRALQHMHELGIVHRDLNPANIMIRSDNRSTVLLDLGAAASFKETGNKTEFFGTLTYASPEDLNKSELDNRSDIFSLGIVMVEMITGSHPFFVESNLEQSLNNIRQGRILPEVRNAIPQEYRDIVNRMLAVDPAERYSSCEELTFDSNLMSLSHNICKEVISFKDAVFPLAPAFPSQE